MKKGLWTIFAALLIPLFCAAAALAGDAFRLLAPGMWFGKITAGDTVRRGKPDLAVLRLDPARYGFRVLAAGPKEEGCSAGAWREKTGALAVFNAGQYAEDGAYLGLLIIGGRTVGRLAGRLEALFVAGPTHGALPPARVIDLRYTSFDPVNSPYREAAQSLMLLDRFGQIRVRPTPKIAHRTLVAQDANGFILVITSEGGHTLWELASFLSESGLGLREVMCMDGGSESQLDLKVGGFRYRQYGSPSAGGDLPIPWPTTPLPVALGVFPKDAPPKRDAPR